MYFRKIFRDIIDILISLECSLTIRHPRKGKRLLIFRKDGLGDVIIFYPTLKYFKEFFTGYEITLVIPSIASGLENILSDVDDIIYFDVKKFSKNLLYRRRFIKDIVKRDFSYAVYPVYSREHIGDLIMKLTRASDIVGFYQPNLTPEHYTRLISVPESITSEFDRNIYFLREITGNREDITIKFPTINLEGEDPTKSFILLQSNNLISKKYCVVFPGAGAAYRVWSEKKFAYICDYLIEIGITPVVCGLVNDRVHANLIKKYSTNSDRIVDLTGKTSLIDLGHILKHSLFYFGSETGTLHLAAALDVPTVCLLGGGHFWRFFPYGNLKLNRVVFDHHMKCMNDNWKCGNKLPADKRAPCIEGISQQDVKKTIEELLDIIRK